MMMARTTELVFGLSITILSFLGGFLGTKLAIYLGHKFNILDKPDKRKVHREPIPRTGGIGIISGVLLSVLIAILIYPGEYRDVSLSLLWVISSSFVLGLLDDIYDLKPILKLLGQIAIGSVAWFLGLRVEFLTNFLPWLSGKFIFLSPFFSFSFTVLWFVAIMNAMNLIDGLDGLLAGVSVIIGLAMSYISFSLGREFVGFITLSLVGASLGFLTHNFHPAKVFLGDSGSLQLGALLAAVSILGPLKTFTLFSIAPVILIFAIPLGDTTLAIIRRLLRRKPIFSADKEHIHHQLLRIGFNQVQAVLILYLVATIFSIIGVFVGVKFK